MDRSLLQYTGVRHYFIFVNISDMLKYKFDIRWISRNEDVELDEISKHYENINIEELATNILKETNLPLYNEIQLYFVVLYLPFNCVNFDL